MTARSVRLEQLLDGLAYVVTVLALVVAASAVVTLPFGGGLRGLKQLLFLVGFGILAYVAIRTRPRTLASKEREQERSRQREVDPEEFADERRAAGTSVEQLAERLLPLELELSPDQRPGPLLKLSAAGVVVLATSALLEFVAGV